MASRKQWIYFAFAIISSINDYACGQEGGLYCDSLPPVSNGMIIYTPGGAPHLAGTIATYLCDPGYFLFGMDETRVCSAPGLPMGTWSGGFIVCVIDFGCQELPSPNNGYVTYGTATMSPFAVGTVATYGCDDGYTLMGEPSEPPECQSGGLWSVGVTPPTCEDINECTRNTDNCAQTCTNTAGSFTCGCNSGYTLNSDGRTCSDINECTLNTDNCAQTCTNTAGSFTCGCNSGYTLNSDGRTCSDINECTLNTDNCAQTCTNTAGSFTCSCNSGYTLNSDGRTCSDINECTLNTDNCAQTCTNTAGSFTCGCYSGYTLNSDGRTCSEINECARNTDNCAQICINTAGSFTCSCNSGYTLNSDGRTCSDIIECNSNNGGCAQTCTNTPGSFQCSCNSGYDLASNGRGCDDINECTRNTDNCAQTCTNTVGSFTCSCNSGYTLDSDGFTCSDINECNSNNGGCAQTCTNTLGSAQCSCTISGYDLASNGRDCNDINECTRNTDNCAQTCTNTVGSFTCSCNSGYTLDSDGFTCSDINECNSNNGGCAQTCTNTPGSFQCSCNSGYELASNGLGCDEINECTRNTDNCAQTCTNTVGSFTCSCNSGYTLNSDGFTCSDINECNSNNGGCAQICTNTPGSFQCSCDSGYDLATNGRGCDDINECTRNTDNCAQTCTNTVGSFTCSCNSGYTLDSDGFTCSDINECNSNNGGCAQTCTNTPGSAQCSCNSGYDLASNDRGCDDINECTRSTDNCAQTCTNIVGSFTCGCNSGYTLNSDGRTCSDVDECSLNTDECQQVCVNLVPSFRCECNSGYSLNGNGRTCSAISCPSLLAPANGDVSFSTAFGGVATYTCDGGYGRSGGDVTRTCGGDGSSPNGVWSGVALICQSITCPDLPGLTNGMITYSPSSSAPYALGAMATYSCDTGYRLSGGDTTRSCSGDSSSSNGFWFGTAPICEVITCPSLSAIPNGDIGYSTPGTSSFNYNTIATYTCNTGFYLDGDNTQTCVVDGSGSNGEWSGSAPVCIAIECSSLSPPDNGVITYGPDVTSPFDYQTTASYSCNDGYGLSGGDISRQCVTYSLIGDGWSGTAPTCETITCPTLPPPSNGRVSYSTASPYTVGAVITYSCDEGYGLNRGDMSRTCGGDGSSSNGEWDGTTPTCEAITCPDLTVPSNGVIDYSSSPHVYGSTASYSCVDGFGLVEGGTTRTCGGDSSSLTGTWSDEAPTVTCQAITCSSLSSVLNGVISYSPNGASPFSYSTIATYTCDEGYFLDGNRVRTCGGDGTGVDGMWSGSRPVCSAIMCPMLSVPENGFNITYSEEPSPTLGFMETATYSCGVGFGLSGGDKVRTCVGAAGSSGEWSGTTPNCRPITCLSLGAPANGQVNFSSSLYIFETVATFTCNTGFGLDGDTTRTCGGDGSSIDGVWSGSSPTCVEYTCTSLPSIDDGVITYSPDMTSPFDYGTTATYSCNEGFYPSGRPDRTCSGSGLTSFWDGTQPECLAIVCTSLISPANGSISYDPDNGFPFEYEYETTANYSCDSGYGLSGGDSSRECVDYSVSGGEWSGTASTCEVITCPSLSAPVNGQVFYSVVSPFTSEAVATYSCNEGYILDPVMTMRTCEGDGSTATGVWSGVDPICEVITCPDLTDPINGVITFSPNTSTPYEFGTTATYSCDAGYGLNEGDRMRSCEKNDSTTNGVWSGEPSSCGAITCSSLSPVNNGVITYSPDTTEPFDSSTTATYSCDEGFYLEGSENRTCSGDGSSAIGTWSGTTSVCLVSPTNLLFTLDDVNCDTVNVTWETILAEELVGTFSFRVEVTERSTGEITRALTTTDHFVTLTFLSCCEEYDFTVSTGIIGIYGEPVMHDEGFKTLPDLSESVTVSVAVESEISLIVSWVEPPSILSQRSPTDAYIVTVTPDCQYYQPQDLTVPGPQTAFSSKSSLGVTGLDPNVAYKVRVNTTICDSSLLVYEQTWHTTSGNAPVLSVSRRAEDPSLANIEWLSSSEIAVNISVLSGDVYNPSNLVEHVAVNSTTTSLQGLDVCTPYWVVVSSETCFVRAVSSSPYKLDLVDAVPFEFMFNLEKEDSCMEFIQTESADAIFNLENAMKEFLQSASAKCSIKDVTCFGSSILSCSEKDPLEVLFSTKLVSQGPGKGSTEQSSCLTEWLEESPSVKVSNNSDDVSLYPVPLETTPNEPASIPFYAIALIVIAGVSAVGVLTLTTAALSYKYYKSTRVKTYTTAESAFGNPTYAEIDVTDKKPSLPKSSAEEAGKETKGLHKDIVKSMSFQDITTKL